jgi:hypothetical protein
MMLDLTSKTSVTITHPCNTHVTHTGLLERLGSALRPSLPALVMLLAAGLGLAVAGAGGAAVALLAAYLLWTWAAGGGSGGGGGGSDDDVRQEGDGPGTMMGSAAGSLGGGSGSGVVHAGWRNAGGSSSDGDDDGRPSPLPRSSSSDDGGGTAPFLEASEHAHEPEDRPGPPRSDSASLTGRSSAEIEPLAPQLQPPPPRQQQPSQGGRPRGAVAAIWRALGRGEGTQIPAAGDSAPWQADVIGESASDEYAQADSAEEECWDDAMDGGPQAGLVAIAPASTAESAPRRRPGFRFQA